MAVEYVFPRSRIYIDTYEVDARLKQLGGITREPLLEAALHGDLIRRSTSALEFPGAPAYKAASSGLSALRSQMATLFNWHHDSYLGIPVTYNRDETVAIAVTEGDDNVGRFTEVDPKTKALKGPNTTKAVDANRLFDDPPVSFWYLLTFSDDEGLYVELSSPAFSESGQVSGWHERLLLGEIRETGGALRTPEIQSPPTEQAVVNIFRKRA